MSTNLARTSQFFLSYSLCVASYSALDGLTLLKSTALFSLLTSPLTSMLAGWDWGETVWPGDHRRRDQTQLHIHGLCLDRLLENQDDRVTRYSWYQR